MKYKCKKFTNYIHYNLELTNKQIIKDFIGFHGIKGINELIDQLHIQHYSDRINYIICIKPLIIRLMKIKKGLLVDRYIDIGIRKKLHTKNFTRKKFHKKKIHTRQKKK